MTGLETRVPVAGSVCSGYGGLDLAAREVFGAHAVWFADNDPAASAVLAHHWPDVPNLGDIRAVDWTTVPPVDLMTGGTPCQDLSIAGKRAGMSAGTQSGVWHSMCDAIEATRPLLVLWENVRGALSAKADSSLEPCPGCVGDVDDRRVLRALGRVLGDLADLGYDAVWCGLPAAAVGCAHLRWRIFVAAVDTRARNWPLTLAQWCATAVADPGRDAGAVVADTDGERVRQQPVPDGGREGAAVAVDVGAQHAVADPVGGGRDRRARVAGRNPVGRAPVGRDRAAVVADAAGPRRGPARGDTGECGGADGGGAPQPRRRRGPAADPSGDRRPQGGTESAGEFGGPDAAQCGAETVADADGERRAEHPQRHGGPHGPEAVDEHDRRNPVGRGVEDGRPAGAGIDWREYTAAIRHHELTFGRPAPDPTIVGTRGQPKLSPWFTEWLMGIPAGHVTDVPGLTANQRLKLCGNGVVVAQAAEAFRWLAARLLDTVADCTDCPDCDGCHDESVA